MKVTFTELGAKVEVKRFDILGDNQAIIASVKETDKDIDVTIFKLPQYRIFRFFQKLWFRIRYRS